jgi:hypothetical protein
MEEICTDRTIKRAIFLEAAIMVDWVSDYNCIVKKQLLYDAKAMQKVYKIYYWFPDSVNESWDRGLSRVQRVTPRSF